MNVFKIEDFGTDLMAKLHNIKWHIAILAMGLMAIGAHFFLKFQKMNASWPLLLIIFLALGPLSWQILKKLYQKNFGADVLAVISIIAALILGEYLAGVLVIIMMVSGQALELIALGRASSAFLALAERMPTAAKRKMGAIIEDIEISEIKIGDLMYVAPFEVSPVDGVVEEGHGFMDESYLTGEPYRVAKAPGANVISGAINQETVLLVRTEKKPEDSRYQSIMNVMKEAEEKRPHMQRLADQIGTIFTPISLAVAFFAWFYSGDPLRFLSVLVIATPCPLLIAIPVALISAISLAARRGIIISDPAVLEKLPTCTTAIFDKTGTLTYGEPVLKEIITHGDHSSDDVLSKVASLEQYSKHPLAKAVIDAAKARKVYLAAAKNVQEKPGHGMMGEVFGHQILITSRKKFAQKELLPKATLGLECVVLIDDQYAALMRFYDAPKKDSHSFISHLEASHPFNKIMLLSGDREIEVAYLAKQLGIELALSSKSPEEKLAIVQKEVKRAPTLFMGDGINDAPALRVATVGIAFGQPTKVTQEAAGAVVMQNSLAKVDELLHLSQEMRKIAIQSAVGGMLLSFLGMGFASFGLVSPVLGAILQQVIDALAIANSLRLTWQKDIEIDLPQA